MLENDLRKLHQLQAPEKSKLHDWHQIENKSEPYINLVWKQVGIYTAIAAIVFILVASYMPKKWDSTTAAGDIPAIQTIYFANKQQKPGLVPHSTFYPFVDKYSGKELSEINRILSDAEWGYIGNFPSDSSTYKFVDIKGLERTMHHFWDAKYEYLVDPTVYFGYKIKLEDPNNSFESAFLRVLMTKSLDQDRFFVMVFILIPIVILSFVQNYRYRKETGIQKNPKRYANAKQQFVPIVVLLSLFSAMYYIENVHYIWWVIGLLIVPILFQLLDDRSEHYAWRVQNMWFSTLIAFVCVSIYIYRFLF